LRQGFELAATPARVGDRDERREQPVEQRLIGQEIAERAAVRDEPEAVGCRIEREVERQHEHDAQREHEQPPAHRAQLLPLRGRAAQPEHERGGEHDLPSPDTTTS
jgi:hypothetical protein